MTDETLPTFNAETLLSRQPSNLLGTLRDIASTRIGALTPETTHTDMTPAELVAALNYRAAWLMKHVKVGSSILTTAAAFCMANEMQAAAEALAAMELKS